MRQRSFTRANRFATVLALLATLVVGPARAGGGINPDADAILRSMSSFLAGTSTFSVSVDIGNEIITVDGEKLQLNSYSTVLVKRPGLFYATRQGRFADVEMFFDGKAVTLYGNNLNAYLQLDVAGSVDDAIAAIESAVGIALPGADLLVAEPYAVLSEGVTSSGYHGTTYVRGIECHHLSFREDQVDWQIWVATGDQPLPLKYVITTKWTTGAPQYSVQLSDWNLRPDIATGRFTFVAPAGAQKLETLPVDEAGELSTGREEN